MFTNASSFFDILTTEPVIPEDQKESARIVLLSMGCVTRPMVEDPSCEYKPKPILERAAEESTVASSRPIPA